MDISTIQSNPWLLLLVLIDIILKAFGCWYAAKNNQMFWFAAMLIFNTGGILPALYLKFFQKDKNPK